MNVSQEQIKLAAAAGLALLKDEDLKVPIHLAMNGVLGLLQLVLQGVVNGEVVVIDRGGVDPEESPSSEKTGPAS